jgi:hypothetical protein
MSIFCKEAQAHLQTHLVGSNHQPSTSSGSGTLITPDLWLKDCKNSDDDGSGLAGAGSVSPKSSISSQSNHSVSPSPKIESPPEPKAPSPVKQKVDINFYLHHMLEFEV